MTAPESIELTPLQKAAISRKLIEAEIVAQAWADEAFLSKLEADPVTALTEAGISVPEGKTIHIVREKAGTIQIVLPTKPELGNEVYDEELAAVAGGAPANDLNRCKYRWDTLMMQDGPEKTGRNFLSGFGALIGFSWAWE